MLANNGVCNPEEVLVVRGEEVYHGRRVCLHFLVLVAACPSPRSGDIAASMSFVPMPPYTLVLLVIVHLLTVQSECTCEAEMGPGCRWGRFDAAMCWRACCKRRGKTVEETEVMTDLAESFRRHNATRNANRIQIHELVTRATCVLRYGTPDTFALLPLLMLRGRGRPSPTFLEIGANDGIGGSQTRALEVCFNWTGVLVEASTPSFAALTKSPRHAAKIHAAACRNGESVQMTDSTSGISASPNLTTTKYVKRWQHFWHNMTNVKCRELGTIFDDLALAEVDFSSIDVQGAEEVALRTVDVRRLGIILVEAEATDLAKNLRVHALLTGAGYQMNKYTPIEANHLHHTKRSGRNELYTRLGPMLGRWSPSITAGTTCKDLVVDALATWHDESSRDSRARDSFIPPAAR